MTNPCNDLLLQEIYHYGPVTALKFHGDRLFVGYGPVLQLFSIGDERYTHLWLRRVFRRNKVHYIAVNERVGLVCVCGSRSFSFLSLDGGQVVERAINEWIMTIEFLSALKLAILTSHNQVMIVEFDFSPDSKFTVLQTVHCNEKSILYSGSITKATNGKVYIAAGTVMDGIFVWDLNTLEVIHHLTEHEGSIFAVKVDESLRYLVSCSDDRSIKAYSFRSGELLASGWGHGSRIWSLLFGALSDTTLQIVSMGEDCSTRVWDYTGDPILQCTKTFERCHEGKHIWSGDADFGITKTLATGGADGKVRLLDIDPNFCQETNLQVAKISDELSVDFRPKEYMILFVCLPHIDLTVAVTSLGKVLVHQRDLGWAMINKSEPITDFVSLKSIPKSNAVVLVTKEGSLLSLVFMLGSFEPTFRRWHLELAKSYQIINAISSAADDRLYLLLDSPCRDSVFILKQVAVKDDEIQIVYTKELCKPKDCTFTPTSLYYDCNTNWLFVGSRHANLAVYDLSNEEDPYLVRKVCAGDTITSVSTVFSASSQSEAVLLLTVRDGTYLYIRFTSDPYFAHQMIHQNKFAKGSVEGTFVHEQQIYLYGFNSSSFYLWNETEQIEIVNAKCGGSHRQWEFIADYGRFQDVSFFAFISKSGLVARSWIHRFGLSNLGLLVAGTHGREIRSIAFSPVFESDGSRLVVTVSEDSTVKIGNVFPDGLIRNRWTMRNHISGLQSVKFVGKDFFVTCAANEELIVWKVDRFRASQYAVIEKARLPVSGAHSDLRVMNFSALETSDGFVVAAVFSNSVLKLFSYSIDSIQFSQIAETSYCQYCLLVVEFLVVAENTFVCVGATDGIFTLWDVTTCLNCTTLEFPLPIIKQPLHQSAIKAFKIIRNDENDFDLLSGGDDNALVHSRLSVTEQKLELEVKSFVEKAASATITGIVAVDEKRVFVTSVDQIVRLWEYKDELVCAAANYTTVADTGCCASTTFGKNRYAVAAGAGVSVFKLPSGDS